jgi:hypothetical protein
MSRIWRYVLKYDNGMAPCSDSGMLTLTCCKPKIRKNARVGEWVLGFVPKGKARGHIAWVGQIAEVVPMGDYERRFPDRQDAIYRLVESGGHDYLMPLRDDYHPDEGSRSTDRSGINALIFDPFWYWGGLGVQPPDEIADLAHYFVGQSTTNSSPDRISALRSWLNTMPSSGVLGKPRDNPVVGKQGVAANSAKARRRRSC